MKQLNNKTSIVTGASRGIGKAIAIQLAEAGSDIAFTYYSNEEKALELEKEILSKGVKAKGYKSDASNFKQTEEFVNQVLIDFNNRIDICVNNAGVSIDNLLLRMTEEQWNETIQKNLNSVFNVTKQVIRPMMKAKVGSIINLSSIIGIRGNAGQASYAASKAGIIAFTKSIAQELGSRNIRCNAIAPGFVETDMTSYLSQGEVANQYLQKIPLGRFGKAEDIAQLALFLASDSSSYITGQTISICGGLNI